MAGQQDEFALGVDLGTSNTVAVLRWPDGRTRPLLVDGQPILPSGVYADADGRLHVGRDAQRLAQADPAGYEPNPKRRVDEPSVSLGGRAYPPAELLAATLRAVAESAVAAAGFLPPAVVTYPAAWEAPRRQVLHEALALAGWPTAAEHTMSGPIPPGTRLLREPVAAARYYTDVLRRPVPVGDAVAVFDFGGGTLDVAVVRNEGADPWGDSGFTVISTGGVADLGGLDLDAALVGRLGELVADADPARWARLTTPETTTQWRDRQQLWDNVRGAKEMLSRATVAPVAVPGVETAARLDRADLERLATPLLARAVAETREVIAAAGLTPERLAGLFLVGGSSRIPLVARMLHAELGIAPTVLEQPELPVAEGALTDLPMPRPQSRPAPVAAGAPGHAPAAAPGAPGHAAPHGTPGQPATPHQRPGHTPAGAPASAGDAAAHGTPGQPATPHQTPGHAPATHGSAGDAAGVADPAAKTATAATLPRPAPTRPDPYLPGQAVSPAAGTGAGWAGVPRSAPPVSPAPGGGPTGPGRPRRGLWIALGAGLAVVGVLAATVLWLTRDRYPALEFRTLGVVATPKAGAERAAAVFTSVLGDRAYLAHQLADDRLEVVAVDAGSGDELWRKATPVGAQRWAGIRALPGGVAVLADASGDSTPRDLLVLDAGSGDQRWRLAVHGDDDLHYTRDTVVWVDRTGDRLVGLRMRDGHETWRRDSPRDEYGSNRTRVVRVGTPEAWGGVGFVTGAPTAPWLGTGGRLVQVGADRSVRLIDMDSGEVLRSRPNVADVDDLVVAHADRLYVTENERGYRLLGYDLASLGEPDVLYTAPDDGRRPQSLVACGEHRACLLEVPDGETARTEVVAATEGKGSRHWPAPEADGLVPVGEHLLARRDSPQYAVTLFDADGRAVLADRDGVAVRLDAGNVLLFAEPLSTAEDDRSLAGMAVGGKAPFEMGELKDVRSESCSWNASMIACGREQDFVLYRFAGDD
ncbi:putative pyrroloquinoline-quinone binding quinoprotein [Micromonospora palomenae]|uniref:Putative pyrroloquinoline-quinone binding quinoprotein n=2 Tax=Micromonospora palomenae TaxID=1461247 RepID=A0A561VP90_9ACTN|nr:Hsp70 family protein [Micromonospora palomenae]TWG13407.1 putative pyrroloquinoline-quinone binding quinoprotein [Micromonospora palomenae]